MNASHAAMLATLRDLQRIANPTPFQKRRRANLHRIIQIAAYPRSNRHKKL